ncbi:MAG: LysM peptidoglycan-binding domain-containing protein [Gaiellaceae bacterium]
MFVRLVVITLVAAIGWAGFVRPSEGAGREQVYVVRPTDTLWSIAATHYAGDPREAIWKLQRRNGLEGTLLRPGQRLVLPT